jgi:hypothetical protein
MAQPQARALQNVLDNIKVGINGAGNPLTLGIINLCLFV